MKVGDYIVENSLRQSIDDARGKMSTLFMSGDVHTANLSGKKALHESVRMDGYEVNVRMPLGKTDTHQPMARYSEFWIG